MLRLLPRAMFSARITIDTGFDTSLTEELIAASTPERFVPAKIFFEYFFQIYDMFFSPPNQ